MCFIKLDYLNGVGGASAMNNALMFHKKAYTIFSGHVCVLDHVEANVELKLELNVIILIMQ